MNGTTSPGVLEGPEDVLRGLNAAGIATVADVLQRSETVRDLRDRSNHVLRVGRNVIFVKRTKSRRPPEEAAALALVAAAGVPVPRLAFSGRDPQAGGIVGTFDLAPRRPLDDLLKEGRLSPAQVDAAFRSLAEAVARLHRAHLGHRDLYLAHVYADPGEDRPSVVLIDWQRHWPVLGPLGHRVVKDLAAIESSIPEGTVRARARLRFLGHYLRARGFPVRTLLSPLARRVLKKAARIRRHAPRTPVGEAARPKPTS